MAHVTPGATGTVSSEVTAASDDDASDEELRLRRCPGHVPARPRSRDFAEGEPRAGAAAEPRRPQPTPRPRNGCGLQAHRRSSSVASGELSSDSAVRGFANRVPWRGGERLHLRPLPLAAQRPARWRGSLSVRMRRGRNSREPRNQNIVTKRIGLFFGSIGAPALVAAIDACRRAGSTSFNGKEDGGADAAPRRRIAEAHHCQTSTLTFLFADTADSSSAPTAPFQASTRTSSIRGGSRSAPRASPGSRTTEWASRPCTGPKPGRSASAGW